MDESTMTPRFRVQQNLLTARLVNLDWCALIVYSIALALGVGVIGLVLICGSDFPIGDGWNHTRDIHTAQQTETVAKWIFTTSPEQRWPFRLMRWGIYRGSTGSLKPLLVLNAIVVVIAGLWLVRCIQRLRGEMVFSDLLVPLALFGPAHVVEFLHYNKASFIWPSCIICACYGTLFAHGRNMKLMSAIILSTCVACLPHLGSAGLIHSPFLVVATVSLAFKTRGTIKGALTVGLICSILGMLINGISTALAMAAPTASTHEAVARVKTIDGIAETFVGYFASSCGALANRIWPLSGLVPILCVIATFVLMSTTFRRDDKKIPSLMIAVCALGTSIAIGLVIAVIRDKSGVPTARYVMLATPALCLPYLVLSQSSSQLSRALQFLMMFWVATQFWYSAAWAHDVGMERRTQSASLAADLDRPVDINTVAARHASYWAGGKEKSFIDGIIAYSALTGISDIGLDDGWDEDLVGIASFDDVLRKLITLKPESAILLTGLSKSREVALIQFQYTLESAASTALMSVEWQSKTVDGWSETSKCENRVNLLLGKGVRTTTFEVNAKGERFRWSLGIPVEDLKVQHVFVRYR